MSQHLYAICILKPCSVNTMFSNSVFTQICVRTVAPRHHSVTPYGCQTHICKRACNGACLKRYTFYSCRESVRHCENRVPNSMISAVYTGYASVKLFIGWLSIWALHYKTSCAVYMWRTSVLEAVSVACRLLWFTKKKDGKLNIIHMAYMCATSVSDIRAYPYV